MLKTRLYFLLLPVLIFYSSCTVTGPQINLYGPAMYSSDISYQPKPMSSDSVHHANYASLSYFSLDAPNNNNNFDIVTVGQFNIGQGYTFDNFNLSYAAFGGMGGYSHQTNNDLSQSTHFSSKYFGDLGGRFSANAFVTSGRVDIRFIGFEVAYSHEFGDYANFRSQVNGQPDYFTDARTDLVTIGGSTEVIWHSSERPLQFGLRLFIGRTLGDNTYRNPGTPATVYYQQNDIGSLAYFMQLKKVFFVGELHSFGGELRAGLRF